MGMAHTQDVGTDVAEPTGAPRPAGVRTLLVISVLVLLATIGWRVVASRPPAPLEADTPERMLTTITGLVEEGEAGRIAELIELAPPGASEGDLAKWQALRVRLGRVLQASWELGEAVRDAYPDEVAALADEEGAGSLGALFGGMGGGSRRAGGERRGGLDVAAGVMRGVLADPYGSLREGADRIAFTDLADDEVAVLWDGRTVFPPVGLTARRGGDGVWRVVLPTTSLAFARFVPDTEAEFAAYASILATLENLLAELERDVRAGRFAGIDDLADAAVRRAVIPLGMAMAAFEAGGEDGGEGGP